MTDKARSHLGAKRANWILFAVLALVAAALYASMFIKPSTFGS